MTWLLFIYWLDVNGAPQIDRLAAFPSREACKVREAEYRRHNPRVILSAWCDVSARNSE